MMSRWPLSLAVLLLAFGAAAGSRPGLVGSNPKDLVQVVLARTAEHERAQPDPELREEEEPPRPVFPTAYEVKYALDCPLVDAYQHAPGRTEVHIWRDDTYEGDGAQKIVRGGTEVTLELLSQHARYYLFPFYEYRGCFADKIESDGGPVRKLAQWGGDKLSPVLPDLTEERWQYNGTVVEDGQTLIRWQWLIPGDDNADPPTRDLEYNMYVTPEGVPVKLDTWGLNFYTGGHWDHYISYYYDYVPGPVDTKVFEVPKACNRATPKNPAHFGYDFKHSFVKLHKQMGDMVPSSFFGDDEYDLFAHSTGRKHASADEYEARKDAFHASKAEVTAINADASVTWEAALNHMADWLPHEHDQLRLHRHKKRDMIFPGDDHFVENYSKPPVSSLNYTRVLGDRDLPSTVDWRDTGADGPIKDQNYCGSCWAFSAIAPMEAAYWRAYGEQLLLSEQQLLNCGWKYGARGCFGGAQDHAFAIAMLDGMITAEALPYTSTDGVCPNDVYKSQAPPPIMRIKSYYAVPAGVQSTQEALLLKGPLAVSIDYQPSLKWYTSGIYSEASCHTAQEDTNHAVALVGYGIEDGVAYWIVKNIWGTYWGEEGYLRIAAEGNDCGISSGAYFVELDMEETDAMREQYAAWKAAQETRLDAWEPELTFDLD